MMNLSFISAQNIAAFEDVRSCLQKVIDKACHGEFDTDDIRNAVLKGRAYIAYARDEEGEVEIACAWEMVFYPRLTCVNVMALGGKNMKTSWTKYGAVLSELWKKQGADCVECMTSRAMARLLKASGFPVEPVYILSRGELK